jgi:hypothetical protein
MAKRVKPGQVYVYRPINAIMSLMEFKSVGDLIGRRVRVIELPGAPPPGTAGMAHVEDVETGKIGLVKLSGLHPVGRHENPGRGSDRVWTFWWGFRNSDPHTVVVLSQKEYSTEREALKRFNEIVENDVRDLWEGADWGDMDFEEFADDVVYGGPFNETVSSVVENHMLRGFPLREFLHNLREGGEAYIGV